MGISTSSIRIVTVRTPTAPTLNSGEKSMAITKRTKPARMETNEMKKKKRESRINGKYSASKGLLMDTPCFGKQRPIRVLGFATRQTGPRDETRDFPGKFQGLQPDGPLKGKTRRRGYARKPH